MSSSWPPDGAAGAGRSVVAAGTDGLFRLVDTVGWSSCGCYGAIFADPRRRLAGNVVDPPPGGPEEGRWRTGKAGPAEPAGPASCGGETAITRRVGDASPGDA